jgi:hypothetical protein
MSAPTLAQQLSDSVLLANSIAGDLHEMARIAGASPRRPVAHEPYWVDLLAAGGVATKLYYTEQTVALLFLVANQADVGLYQLTVNGVAVASWRGVAATNTTVVIPFYQMAPVVVYPGLPLALVVPAGGACDCWLAVVSRSKDA